MALEEELVKVIDRSKSGSRNALVGVAVGAIAGAGGAAAALRHRGAHNENVVDLTDGDRKIGPFDRKAAGMDSSKDEKGPKAKLMRFSERKGFGWLGRSLQVQRRFGELKGNNIASSVAMQVFLSIFPLLLVAAAVIGFVQHGSSTDVAQSLVSNLGLGASAAEPISEAVQKATESRNGASILGFVTLLWSALGVTSALQYAYNQAWQSSDRGIKDKGVGLLWLIGAALLFVASTVATTALNWLPAGVGVLGSVVGLLLSFALWMFTGKVLPNVDVPWKALVPGAILGVVGLEALKFAGAVWVPRAVESSSAVYGAIGVVFAVLAWVILFGKLVMYSAILNVLVYEGKSGVTMSTIEVPQAAAKGESDDVTRGGNADKP